MKSKSNKFVILAIFLLLLISTLLMGRITEDRNGQDNFGKDPRVPEVSIVTEDGRDVPYVTGLNQWDGACYDRLSTEEIWNKAYKDKDKPQVAPGTQIEIRFDPSDLPSEVIMYQSSDAYKVIACEINDSGDAYIMEFQPGEQEDFFVFTCTWKDDGEGFMENECEYEFYLVSSDLG